MHHWAGAQEPVVTALATFVGKSCNVFAGPTGGGSGGGGSGGGGGGSGGGGGGGG